ncbi:unnamed protein product [Symbiodinium necroappetens]|uniref:Uncharacterized protein n=1 Tax=Symbiodinium necroappetens TaxID=1628268 RepID=A0A812K153_9DINO|nr:unnamed protein product [Symbiodinium necroappetens]
MVVGGPSQFGLTDIPSNGTAAGSMVTAQEDGVESTLDVAVATFKLIEVAFAIAVEGHRLETCTSFATKQILKLKNQRKDRVTERAQLYGKDGVRKISRSEQRRVKPRACALIAQINTAEDAADWLQQHKFVKKPRSCPQCQKKRLSFCVEARDRGPHWRCLHCKTHVSFLTDSPFRGLKANPVMLLIRNYEQMDATKAPRPTELVQACKTSWRQAWLQFPDFPAC